MRQRGQYQDKLVALGIIEGKPGWTVQPILICKANTMYSPTYDDPNSAEFKLRHAHGLSSDEIVPALVRVSRQRTIKPRLAATVPMIQIGRRGEHNGGQRKSSSI